MEAVLIKANSLGELCDKVSAMVLVEDDRGRALMDEEKARLRHTASAVDFIQESLYGKRRKDAV